jgi:hypothetical protein
MMPGSPGRSSSNNPGNNNNPSPGGNNNPTPGGNHNPTPGGNHNPTSGNISRRRGRSHSPSRLYEHKGWQIEPIEDEYKDTGGYASDDTSIPKIELKSLKLGYNVSKIGRSIDKLEVELKKINDSGISNRIIRIKKINSNTTVRPYPENEYMAYNNCMFFVENGQDITKAQLANLSNIYAKGASRLDAAVKLDADARTFIAGLSAEDKRLFKDDIDELWEYRDALPALIERWNKLSNN